MENPRAGQAAISEPGSTTSDSCPTWVPFKDLPCNFAKPSKFWLNFPTRGKRIPKNFKLKDSSVSAMELEIYFVPKELELPLVCHPRATKQGEATAAFFLRELCWRVGLTDQGNEIRELSTPAQVGTPSASAE